MSEKGKITSMERGSLCEEVMRASWGKFPCLRTAVEAYDSVEAQVREMCLQRGIRNEVAIHRRISKAFDMMNGVQ